MAGKWKRYHWSTFVAGHSHAGECLDLNSGILQKGAFAAETHNRQIEELEAEIKALKAQIVWRDRVLEDDPWRQAGYTPDPLPSEKFDLPPLLIPYFALEPARLTPYFGDVDDSVLRGPRTIRETNCFG